VRAASTPATIGSIRSGVAELRESLVSTLARLTLRPSLRAALVRLEDGIVYLGREEIGYVAADDRSGLWRNAGVSDTSATAYGSPEHAALALAAEHAGRAGR
jgi:hypothetical protein